MLVPLILNGLQTQSPNPESPKQLLQQTVPVLGLSAAQQALLAQGLSGLQNQWAGIGPSNATQLSDKMGEQKRPNARRFRDMRRSRTIIQADQLDVLYGCYFKDPNPGKHEFEQISEWVHLPKKVVQIWFQNMRQTEQRRRMQHSTPRRPRTHLNCLQLSILQSCYETCAHPNALECEAVGTELGLPLKVVQIWFQNTRAKEKRWRLQQEKLVRPSIHWTCLLQRFSRRLCIVLQ
uniref:Homeobox domain-containing protein n=1 Tax=Pygocentrus nattereri TaxID=42514 RepID=A0AAR2KGK6_PYGNA